MSNFYFDLFSVLLLVLFYLPEAQSSDDAFESTGRQLGKELSPEVHRHSLARQLHQQSEREKHDEQTHIDLKGWRNTCPFEELNENAVGRDMLTKCERGKGDQTAHGGQFDHYG